MGAAKTKTKTTKGRTADASFFPDFVGGAIYNKTELVLQHYGEDHDHDEEPGDAAYLTLRATPIMCEGQYLSVVLPDGTVRTFHHAYLDAIDEAE